MVHDKIIVSGAMFFACGRQPSESMWSPKCLRTVTRFMPVDCIILAMSSPYSLLGGFHISTNSVLSLKQNSILKCLPARMDWISLDFI